MTVAVPALECLAMNPLARLCSRLGLLAALLWSPVPGQAAELRVRFVDVGQGDSILVRTPSGKGWLVDGGPRNQAASAAILAALEAEGMDRLDGIVITHPHLDHFGGLFRVLDRIPVGTVVGNVDAPGTTWRKFRETLDQKGIAYRKAKAGATLSWDPDLSVRVVAARPQEELDRALAEFRAFSDLDLETLGERMVRSCGEPLSGFAGTRVDLNDHSVVLKVSYGDFDLLLTGDATAPLEEEMLAQHDLDVEVLKVAHHGSRWSSTLEFVTESTPADSVIQSGAGNEYGHPHREAVRRLLGAESQVHRNDESGELVLSAGSNGRYRIETAGSR